MTFYDKFDKLCEERGKKKGAVCIDLGLSKSAHYRWQEGATPEGNTLRRIAEYFGVTVGYLVDDTIEEAATPEDDGDTMRIREAMRRRPGIKLLFDALEDAPDSDLYETLALVHRLKEESKNK